MHWYVCGAVESIVLVGFTDCAPVSSLLLFQMQYMTLNEVTILGRVVDGFFVRSLHHISVEGEEGRNMDTREVVQTATDETQFPGFSFRGYAVLQFSSSQRV